MFILLLGIEDIAEDKMGSSSCSCGAYTLVGEDSKKHINYIIY